MYGSHPVPQNETIINLLTLHTLHKIEEMTSKETLQLSHYGVKTVSVALYSLSPLNDNKMYAKSSIILTSELH